MTDPKAPLPDAVEAALQSLEHELSGQFEEDTGEDAGAVVRAHIAAQAEKIAELELEVADLKDINATVYKSGRMDEAAQMGHKSKTDDEIIAGFHKSHQHQWKQIEALEADKKRLREAVSHLTLLLSNMQKLGLATDLADEKIATIQAALADAAKELAP